MTAPAHVLVFRPIIPRLRAAGPRGRGDRARLRADARAARAARHGAHGVRPPRRRVAAAQARARCCRAHARDAQASAASASSTSRVAHGSNDLALAARRLKIPAVNMFDYEFATLQHNIGCRPGAARDHARHDPARAPAPLRRRPGEARPVPGPEGGVLPRRLRARRRRARPARARPREGDRGRAPAARRVALPPQVEPAVPAGARPTSAATQGVQAVVLPRTDAQREYVRALELPSVVRAGARGRRAEPGRARGPRGLGRRHHEPRGGGARHAGLHDLRR